jgi:hypothetical protein
MELLPENIHVGTEVEVRNSPAHAVIIEMYSLTEYEVMSFRRNEAGERVIGHFSGGGISFEWITAILGALTSEEIIRAYRLGNEDLFSPDKLNTLSQDLKELLSKGNLTE